MTYRAFRITDINPEPWTAPEVAVGHGKGGRAYPVVHKAAGLTAYQEAIREAFSDYDLPEPTTDTVKLVFHVWRELPVNEGQRNHRAHHADSTNMQKALEDALQGILFKNDTQVVDVRTIRHAQAKDIRPIIGIEMWTNPELEDAVEFLLNPEELPESKRPAQVRQPHHPADYEQPDYANLNLEDIF